MSKVRMLSPDSKNSRSFPHITAFNGSAGSKSNKSGGTKSRIDIQSAKRTVSSNKVLKKLASQDQGSDIKIADMLP